MPEVWRELAWLCTREQAALRRVQRHKVGIVTRVCSSRNPSPCQGRQIAGQQERAPRTFFNSHLLTRLMLPLHVLAVVFPPSPGLTPHIGCLCRAACRFVLPSRSLQPSSPSVSLTPAGRLPFSYTRYFLPHCCPLSLAFLILLSTWT
jgi:hypothetical protein